MTFPKALRAAAADTANDPQTGCSAATQSSLTLAKPKIQALAGPPDLQQLVELRGGYDEITTEDWAAFDRATSEYHARRRELLARELAQSFQEPADRRAHQDERQAIA